MESGQLSKEKNVLKTTKNLPKNVGHLIRHSNINLSFRINFLN